MDHKHRLVVHGFGPNAKRIEDVGGIEGLQPEIILVVAEHVVPADVIDAMFALQPHAKFYGVLPGLEFKDFLQGGDPVGPLKRVVISKSMISERISRHSLNQELGHFQRRVALFPYSKRFRRARSVEVHDGEGRAVPLRNGEALVRRIRRRLDQTDVTIAGGRVDDAVVARARGDLVVPPREHGEGLVRSADVLLVQENLRHGESIRQGDHVGALRRMRFDVDVRVGYVAGGEGRLGAAAEFALFDGKDGDASHDRANEFCS
mmetsp:Transcript_11455/g.24805  ORF Transcript_11455/g.24805 Transcript_11455/m.24805 type:complete len:262 (-) Transcript_11455:32-817(-)